MNKCLYCLAFLLLFTKLTYGQQDNNVMISYWHKTLAQRLGVSPKSFKLTQGGTTLLRSTAWMWDIFNAITADTTGYYYNPDQHNSFIAYYNSLLFQSKPIPFSNVDLADSCQVNTAITRFAAANNQYAWDKTIDQLFARLPLSPGLHFTADTMIRTITDQLFKPITIANYLGITITKINVSITCDFGRQYTFAAQPYANLDPNNIFLQNYSPWFSPCVYNKLLAPGLLAKAVRAPFINAARPPLLVCTALVVADSINVCLELQSTSKTILVKIAHYLPVNPDKAITSNIVNKKVIYTLTANSSSPAGNPQLIGVLLLPANLLYTL
ncbi:hypothetical protein ABIB62_003591 [Mucilaginibacter sp. UYP25]|uniref:hypothetical protein n=1 Tax=unclassified Mucilaginibacter TaxID=2617802 RepID=UPI003394C64E